MSFTRTHRRGFRLQKEEETHWEGEEREMMEAELFFQILLQYPLEINLLIEMNVK